MQEAYFLTYILGRLRAPREAVPDVLYLLLPAATRGMGHRPCSRVLSRHRLHGTMCHSKYIQRYV